MIKQNNKDPQQEELKAKIIEQLKKTPVIKTVCDYFKVGRTTLYRWQEDDPEFSKAVELAMVEGKVNINDVSVHQMLSLIHNKDRGAIKYWLEHHHPDYIKHKKDTEEKDSTPSVIMLHSDED